MLTTCAQCTAFVKRFSFILLFSTLGFFAYGNDYDDAWQALNRNDRATAKRLFEKALNDPNHGADAAMMLLMINTKDNNESEISGLWDKIMKQFADPYPFIFALWYEDGGMGSYSKKSKSELKMVQKILDDPNCPGFMKASVNYQMGHHYLESAEFEKMKAAYLKVGQLNNWQYVGPFDNLGGSGFDKNYAPIEKPMSTEKFKSERNSDIWWFTPSAQINDCWVIPSYHLPSYTAIVYAQTFVTADSDKNVLLCSGFNGNIKIWVNDRLLISEQEPRRTELDAYHVPCKLRKGVNRVLVQLGTEEESYGNFSVRFTDEKGMEVAGLTSQSEYLPYTKDTDKTQPALLPFYAENFFQDRIKAQPDNLVNYILLEKVYLRTRRAQEALAIMEEALKKAPESTMLRLQLLNCYSILENRTELTKEVQYIKEHDPDSYFAADDFFDEYVRNQKYDDAWKVLNEIVANYGENQETLLKKVRLYGIQNKVEELVNTITDGYRRYPESPTFAELQHNIYSMLRKDVAGSLDVYSRFLEDNYNLGIAKTLASEYLDAGMNARGIKILTEISNLFPYDPDEQEPLYDYYYGVEDYKKAQLVLDKMISLAPFTSSNYANQAQLYRQQKKENEALANFQKALHYSPNDFDSRRKIREMQNKPELAKYFPQYEIYDIIKNSKSNKEENDYGYSYILDERCTILYPERCSESIYTEAYRILSQKGIDYWKEASIGYNSSQQRLFIEKAEVVKANGSKIPAERNGASVVFPNLEIGDAIYFKYRIVSYAYGRMARELWDEFYFNTYVPSDVSRFCLLAPNDINVNFKTANFKLEPTISEVENFKLYKWEMKDVAPVKAEPSMPSLMDVGNMLFLSTISDWQDISNWYSDLSATQAKVDYEVKKVLANLFPEGQNFTEAEKAKKIYDYVVKNIQYSSVPFRQGAYVPQRAAKVIQTKLGDCKDVSTLYATLAREVGLKANLVLLNTRDNGENTMPLPAVTFNHCIAKVMINGKPQFLELTDRDLPFGSLPPSDIGAQALEIPFNEPGAKSSLFKLLPDNRTPDYRRQESEVKVNRRDLEIAVKTVNSGNGAATIRATYSTMNKQKQMEELQQSIGGKFSNPVSVKDVSFGNFESTSDTIHYSTSYTVKNEVIEVGGLKSFKVPYFYTFIGVNDFALENRQFPVNYWEYENKDEYVETLNINLPDGSQFSDLPKNVDLNFNGTTYSIKFEKPSTGKIKVTRTIKIKRDVISAQDYPTFKKFIEDVLDAENIYLAFK